MVYFVGAGPYDYKLITVRGLELIKTCDCIIYDRLVNKALLTYRKKDAQVIYAAEKINGRIMTQDEINRLILEKASMGLNVVRLRNSDPLLFQRGSEEAFFLKQFGIKYEIVPGVATFSASSAYCGIPLTHRGVSSAVSVFNCAEYDTVSHFQFDVIAKLTGTLVFKFNVKQLKAIVSSLLKYEKNMRTPCAIIYRGASYQQREIYGTLGDIVLKASAAAIKNPSIFIVGDAVSLRPNVRWLDSKSLWAKRIFYVIKDQEIDILDSMYDYGIHTVLYPTGLDKVDASNLSRINLYDAIVFEGNDNTHAFFKNVTKKITKPKIIAISQEISQCLESHNTKVDLMINERSSLINGLKHLI